MTEAVCTPSSKSDTIKLNVLHTGCIFIAIIPALLHVSVSSGFMRHLVNFVGYFGGLGVLKMFYYKLISASLLYAIAAYKSFHRKTLLLERREISSKTSYVSPTFCSHTHHSYSHPHSAVILTIPTSLFTENTTHNLFQNTLDFYLCCFCYIEP